MNVHMFYSTIIFYIFYGIISVQAKHWNITTIYQEPYLLKVSKPNGDPTYVGYIKDLLDRLSKDVGFTYSLYSPTDGEFGGYTSDGNWTGTVNEILKGRADMIAAPITSTSQRAEVVEFTHPFQIADMVIVLRRPDHARQPVADRLTRIWAPFESSVWLLAVAAYFVTSSAIYIISYFNPYEWRRMSHDGEATIREAESFTCMNSFWFSLSALALQGYIRSPRSLGARLVVTAWWIFVIVFVSCYIGKLTSLLKIRLNEEQIEGYMKFQGLEDIVNEDIEFVVIRGGAIHGFIERNTRLGYIEQLKIELSSGGKGKFVANVEDGLKALEDSPAGKKAFLTESLMVKYQVQKHGCQYYFVKENLLKREFSVAFPLNSGMTQRVGRMILKYHEEGFLAHLQAKWFTGTCRQFVYEGSDEKYKIPDFYALDAVSFSGVLLILAIGLGAGVIVTIVEILVFDKAEKDEHGHHRKAPQPRTQETTVSLLDQSKDTTNTQV